MDGSKIQTMPFFRSNFQPSISYWFYGTITGVTGIMLVVVMSIIYVFAAPAVLKQAYHAFHLTHFLNILLYVLIVAHGLPKLLDVLRHSYPHSYDAEFSSLSDTEIYILCGRPSRHIYYRQNLGNETELSTASNRQRCIAALRSVGA